MPRAPTPHLQSDLYRPALDILVLSGSMPCPVLAALLPHASMALRVSVVHDMASMESHLIHNRTDIVVTRVVSEHPGSLTTAEAIYRASVERRVALKDPRSLQCPDIPPPQLLWWANGQGALSSMHAQCWGGLNIHVADALSLVVDAVLHARDAILDAAESFLEASESVLEASGSVLDAPGSVLDAPDAVVQTSDSALEAPRAIDPAWPVLAAPAPPLRSAVA